MTEERIAVVGAGSWGTAFASIPAEIGVPTRLWARRQELADAISSQHENPEYLPGIPLPEALSATHDPEECVAGATIVVMAIPSHAFRASFREVLPFLGSDVPVVSLVKGIEQDSLKRMSEVLQEEGDLGPSRIAVLSGPNLAREIAHHQPAATTVACADPRQAERLQKAFMSSYFRVYTNPDVVGVEVAGAMKNVIAIAAGIADGMRYGDNAKASLITRGLAEMARFGVKAGGNALTFSGLSGMGDLVATCMSTLSRNHHVGAELGKGRKLDDIVGGMNQVAEGVKTARPVTTLAQRSGVDVPICEHVCRVLYEGVSVKDMVASLMGRTAKAELHGIQ